MRKIFKDAFSEVKTLPKGLWVSAMIVPGGLATITLYLVGRTVYKSLIKKENHGREGQQK